MARPRNTESDALILAAAAEALLQDGYDGLVVDEIARSVGVAKTTVYRRWPTKNHLVVSVVAGWQGVVDVPNTGDEADDIANDLTTIAGGMCHVLDPAPIRRLVAELAAARMRDDDLGSAVDRLWSDRRAATAAVLERGIAGGALRRDLDPEVVTDELAGAVYYRVLITGGSLDDAYARALVRTVLAGAR
ncbi:TetR/AcrR family transcriptional regulator [Conyzicola nivalis]|uniref:HTH-type transcriptional regulator YdeS n=1 Tax=Conyzicola nivalis TaxID=1477021 RepID=A0A916SFT9_9MICO|nr:TetR/AcrR family transcriptional regulator [Conyzicola nivalis]GGA95349.1 putative HTH-type transcriptional regulator YdeS [Conyzicola nivalis]